MTPQIANLVLTVMNKTNMDSGPTIIHTELFSFKSFQSKINYFCSTMVTCGNKTGAICHFFERTNTSMPPSAYRIWSVHIPDMARLGFLYEMFLSNNIFSSSFLVVTLHFPRIANIRLYHITVKPVYSGNAI